MKIQPKAMKLLPGIWKRGLHDVLHLAGHDADFSWLARACGMEPMSEPFREGRYAAWCGQCDLNIAPEYPSPEAYGMKIAPDGITVAARTEAGLAMGLKALWRELDGLTEVPCALIQDEPALNFRGTHLCVFPIYDGTRKEDTSPEALRRMIDQAAYWGYNHVFIEFWGTFPYQKHPYACWPDSQYTRATVNGLIEHCLNDLHIQPVPVQNLTSHAGWSRIGSRKHVVLDQRPDLADMWIPGGWCFATENPDTRAFLTDTIDELLGMYRLPPILHVSTDKCFGFGSSEADRVHDADSLFIRHLHFLHDTLAERHVRMMMWTDMLYGALDSKFWKASPAVTDVLPRDIIMNIWTHNDPGDCWPDIDFFQGKGYDTVYSPFINEASIRNMIRLCQRSHSMGILQTTWYCPQTALPFVQKSGKWQWEGLV